MIHPIIIYFYILLSFNTILLFKFQNFNNNIILTFWGVPCTYSKKLLSNHKLSSPTGYLTWYSLAYRFPNYISTNNYFHNFSVYYECMSLVNIWSFIHNLIIIYGIYLFWDTYHISMFSLFNVVSTIQSVSGFLFCGCRVEWVVMHKGFVFVQA